MRFGFVIPGGDVPDIVEVAREVEAAGWDAVFLWEAVYGLDPWVTLGAIAARTERVRLGSLLTPPSRRRPWKLASEVATLDRLSGGRAVLAVGLGATNTGFAEVGESTDRRVRAELMDESLALLQRFWQGEPFSFAGKHHQVRWHDPKFMYKPLQQPRPPIWVVGMIGSERSLERAMRWDGVIPWRRNPDGSTGEITPGIVASLRDDAVAARGSAAGFEIVVEGVTPPDDRAATDRVRALRDAGATWWIESMWEHPGGMAAVRERIAAGPPRLEGE